MNADDLRDTLTDLAARDMYQREGIYEQPGCPWDDLLDSEHKFWRDTATPTIDALMPVVREALAEAWSTGFREGRNADHQSCWWPKNPWRGEQP